MMLRPAINDILKDGQSYYSLVVAVAKRAREITEEAEKEHIVKEFAEGKCKLVERENIGQALE